MSKWTRHLPKHLRDLIDESFANAVERIGEEEFLYIGKHFELKLHALKASATYSVQQLARNFEALHTLLTELTDGELLPSPDSLKLIGATLFYVVNPFDIIPDHIPGEGYMDDEYVMDLCLSRLDAETHARIEELLTSGNHHDGAE